MFKLVWAFMAVTSQGPVTGQILEPLTFKDKPACEQFGREMTQRIEDWTRGAFRLEWHDTVRSKWHCEPAGDPA